MTEDVEIPSSPPTFESKEDKSDMEEADDETSDTESVLLPATSSDDAWPSSPMSTSTNENEAVMTDAWPPNTSSPWPSSMDDEEYPSSTYSHESDTVATSEFEAFDDSEASVHALVVQDVVVNDCHNKKCPHDHDLDTTTFKKLWHHRLGHPHPNVLRTIGFQETISDAQKLKHPTINKTLGCCVGCLLG